MGMITLEMITLGATTEIDNKWNFVWILYGNFFWSLLTVILCFFLFIYKCIVNNHTIFTFIDFLSFPKLSMS